MATPLLNLTTLSTSDSSKEQIISTTFTQIEDALQRKLIVDLSTGDVTLTTAQWTRSTFFDCTPVTGTKNLIVPLTVRIFYVKNSGAGTLTVKGATGSTVVLNSGISAILYNDGTGISQLLNSDVSSFLSLSDTPSSYTGSAGKNLRVNSSGTAIEFGLRNNLTASASPTATDDSASGYGVGSMWFNNNTNIMYICKSNTVSAADWEVFYNDRVFFTGYGPSGVAPTTLLNNVSLIGLNKVMLYPFRFYGGITMISISVRVTTVGSGSNIKLALWGTDYSLGLPTGLAIAGSNTGISCDSLGVKSVTVSIAPPPGIYWMAALLEATTTAPTMHSINPANYEPAMLSNFTTVDTDILRGASNNGLHGISYATAYSTDIMALDLTGASFTIEGGTTSEIPHVIFGW